MKYSLSIRNMSIRYLASSSPILSKNIRAARKAFGTKAIYSDNICAFEEISVIFNRIKKSGNSSIVAFFEDLSRNGDLLSKDTISQIKERRSLLQASPKAILRYPDFNSFVCVRNPYTRAVSGFLDKVAPGLNRKFSHYPGFGNSSTRSFENFLSYLLDRNRVFLDPHFWPQTSLMYQEPKDFTTVGRLENIAHDMKKFLEICNLDSSTTSSLHQPHPKESTNARLITNAAGKAEYLTHNAKSKIERIYEIDFNLLQY